MELGNAIFGHSRGNFEIDREKYQTVFNDFLESLGFDTYGNQVANSELLAKYLDYDRGQEEGQDVRGGLKFENEIFIVRPYYWGDYECFYHLPNFVHKPTGLSIQWYKYSLRDSYSNQQFDPDTLTSVMKSCKDSLFDEFGQENIKPYKEVCSKEVVMNARIRQMFMLAVFEEGTNRLHGFVPSVQRGSGVTGTDGPVIIVSWTNELALAQLYPNRREAEKDLQSIKRDRNCLLMDEDFAHRTTPFHGKYYCDIVPLSVNVSTEDPRIK